MNLAHIVSKISSLRSRAVCLAKATHELEGGDNKA